MAVCINIHMRHIILMFTRTSTPTGTLFPPPPTCEQGNLAEMAAWKKNNNMKNTIWRWKHGKQSCKTREISTNKPSLFCVSMPFSTFLISSSSQWGARWPRQEEGGDSWFTLGSDNSQEITPQKKQAKMQTYYIHGSWSTMYTWNIETSWFFSHICLRMVFNQPGSSETCSPPFFAKWQVKTPAKPSRRKYISLPISPRQMMKSAGKKTWSSIQTSISCIANLKKKLKEITNHKSSISSI